MRPLSARALLPLTLAVCAFAVWRIAWGLATPAVAPTSVVALLEDSAARAGLPAARQGLPAADAAAVARAQALLRAEPLSAEAYGVLALAAAEAGRDGEADRLMAIAAAWWPRDVFVQTWRMDRNLRRGDAPAAMADLDAALHAQPAMLDALTAAMGPVLADPAGREALARRLAMDPPWRSLFIQVAVRLWREPEGLVALFDRLQAEPGGLDPKELRPYLSRLLAGGQVDEAYAAWLRSLSPEQRAGLAYLYNGDFRFPLTQMPFDWETPPVPGTKAAVGAAGGRRVLSVGFLGGRIYAPPVVHALVLAPGDYRLSGRVRTDRLQAENGVRWRIACLAAPDGTLAASEAFVGTAAWRPFTLDVTIPEEGCPAQSLGLEVQARTVLERTVSGVVAFSDLDIAPR